MSPVFDIDFTDYDESGFQITKEGTYLAEVAKVDVGKSRKGDPMLTLRLKSPTNNKTLCFDTIMLGGDGRGMGLGKLIELGVAKKGEKTQLDPVTLIGRRVAIAICHKEYDGQKKARVDIRAPEPFKCGYLNEKAALEAGLVGEAPAPAAEPEDSTPF